MRDNRVELFVGGSRDEFFREDAASAGHTQYAGIGCGDRALVKLRGIYLTSSSDMRECPRQLRGGAAQMGGQAALQPNSGGYQPQEEKETECDEEPGKAVYEHP